MPHLRLEFVLPWESTELPETCYMCPFWVSGDCNLPADPADPDGLAIQDRYIQERHCECHAVTDTAPAGYMEACERAAFYRREMETSEISEHGRFFKYEGKYLGLMDGLVALSGKTYGLVKLDVDTAYHNLYNRPC